MNNASIPRHRRPALRCLQPPCRHRSHKPESKEEELAMEIYDTAPIFSARFEVGEATGRQQQLIGSSSC